MLNAWIDFNVDGDWNDPGEQFFVDQALTGGVNNLTAAIPSEASERLPRGSRAVCAGGPFAFARPRAPGATAHQPLRESPCSIW